MTGASSRTEDLTGTGTPEAPGPFVVPVWRIPGHHLDLSASLVLGIVNLTPDSFSDGGKLDSPEAAEAHARRLKTEGARMLDVGGESTRPGAEAVPVAEELDRVLPFLRRARELGLGPLSVDTRSAEVAREALRSGASVVNDVSGLNHDPDMAAVVAEADAGLILSHMRGTPASMRTLTDYGNLAEEVAGELAHSVSTALSAGVEKERIVVDPGIGFAKTASQSLTVLGDLAFLQPLGCPILVGPSRKSFIGEATGASPEERLPGTIAACVLARTTGAQLFRVHDVAPIVQALKVADAILGARIDGGADPAPRNGPTGAAG
jgi:dihydropteroate synthase